MEPIYIIFMIFVAALFITFLILRSSHGSLSDMGDDRVYQKELRLFNFEIGVAAAVGIVGIVFSIADRSPASTAGGMGGGVIGCIIVVATLISRRVKVMEAREGCLKKKRIEEFESHDAFRTIKRRIRTECDPKTQWRCPRCQSVNSNYTGTCGCGYSKSR